ncbi:hypothetical protein PG988_011874 [Apiospora saccharicola]
MFDIYIPTELTFQANARLLSYLAICQTSRTLVDGFDLKDRSGLLAALAPEVVAEYAAVNSAWAARTFTAAAFADEWLGPAHLGLASTATHHQLGAPYFKSRLAGEDFESPLCKVGAVSGGKSWMEHTFVKVDGRWKISVVRPTIHYRVGSLKKTRGEEEEEKWK